MDALVGFVLEEGRGLYRPVGSVSFNEVVALVSNIFTTEVEARAWLDAKPGPR